MIFHVITIFPEMVRAAFCTGVTGRAVGNGIINLDLVYLKAFSQNSYGSVDDYPYGGGAGLILQCEPIYLAYNEVLKNCAGDGIRVIFPTPGAPAFTEADARELSEEKELIFLCGRYEGVDQRVLDRIVTDRYSIGDYVLSGGELPSLVIMDAVSRLVPGVLGNSTSADTESFSNGLLEYPQYTRPEVWREREAPPILLSGNHGEVDKWRMRQSIELTQENRPDMYREWLRKRGIY